MDIILPLQMDLASKDQRFVQLQELIDLKRKMLLDKQIKYKKITKQNHFLEEIKNDYSNYSNYIMKQKQEQIQALEILNNYVRDLTNSGNLSKQNVKDAKYEQKKIIKELKSIKHNLDEITNNNNDIINNNMNNSNSNNNNMNINNNNKR
jgi:hypothetical protein